MDHELHTETDIDARPEMVWQVLIDLERYADWNPFITSAIGRPAVGEKLSNTFRSPSGKAVTFTPTVTVVKPAVAFEWLGRLGVPRVFDGRHRFDLHLLPGGRTRLVHSEQMNGVLVRVLRKSLDTKTKRSFEDMNEALKTRVETMVSASNDTSASQQNTSTQASSTCF